MIKVKNIFFLSVCPIVFSFLSCGLDSVNYVDEPVSDGHTVSYLTADETQKYFSFRTASDNSSGTFSVLGTAICYKIYDNASTMLSVEQSIDSTSPTSKWTSLTSSYGYKHLCAAGQSADDSSPLIKDFNVSVYIRLTDYNTGNSGDYAAVISSGGSTRSPRRNINQNYGFDFGRKPNNPRPQSGDSDCRVSSSSASTYYIDAYAVTIGEDSSDSNRSYSDVFRLGSISVNTNTAW